MLKVGGLGDASTVEERHSFCSAAAPPAATESTTGVTENRDSLRCFSCGVVATGVLHCSEEGDSMFAPSIAGADASDRSSVLDGGPPAARIASTGVPFGAGDECML